jgi:hypothetical protein
MIYIYGDSHAMLSFNGLTLENINKSHSNITMFRVGRDNTIINFDNNQVLSKNDVTIIVYGEIDCRCHIQKQINLGKNEDDVINELVTNYFNTLKNNLKYDNIKIIVGIIPQSKQSDYEDINGPITHEFPFVGKDEDRIRYTNKMNQLIENMCVINNYIYFNPYSYYTRDDGTLKYELSDSTVHLKDNSHFLKEFMSLHDKVMSEIV